MKFSGGGLFPAFSIERAVRGMCYKCRMFRQLRRLYHWVLHWADTPYGLPALCVLAFAESSVFPLPPDPLLIALAIGRPKKAFRFAFYCTIFSVLGGMLGYAIGLFFIDTIGMPILEFYGAVGKYETIKSLYGQYNAWAVSVAGFTPLPYKVFTIAAGAFRINFPVFVLASFVSRGLRFMILSALVWKFGAVIKEYLEKYFEVLTITFTILLVGGFLLVKSLL